jgi:hypothetical protein
MCVIGARYHSRALCGRGHGKVSVCFFVLVVVNFAFVCIEYSLLYVVYPRYHTRALCGRGHGKVGSINGPCKSGSYCAKHELLYCISFVVPYYLSGPPRLGVIKRRNHCLHLYHTITRFQFLLTFISSFVCFSLGAPRPGVIKRRRRPRSYNRSRRCFRYVVQL